MFASSYTFALYAVYLISCLSLKSERKKEWVSIVSLSEQGFLQGVQLKFPQGVC